MLATLAITSFIVATFFAVVVVAGTVSGMNVPYDLTVGLMRWLAVGSVSLLGSLVSGRVTFDSL